MDMKESLGLSLIHIFTEARRTGRRFDLVFVDPPTFSNSKAMGKRTWDVQRDHVEPVSYTHLDVYKRQAL